VEAALNRKAVIQPAVAGSRGFGSPYLHYLIFAFFLANLLVTMDRTVLGVLIIPIRSELGLSDSQLGALSFAFAAFYALFGLVLGRLTDTRSRSRLLAFSMGLLGVATIACGWTYSFVQLFLARMLCGVGEAGSVPTKYSIIGDSFRPEQRASALALIYSGLGVGAPLGLILAGYLADQVGWRMTFAIFGLPSLLVGLLIFFTIREPTRGAFEKGEDAHKQVGIKETLAALRSNSTFVYIVLGYAVSTFAVYGLGYWIPSFLIRTHGMSLTDVGLIYGSIVGVGMLAGLLVGAAVSNILMRRDRRFEMWIPGAVNILVGVLYAVLFTTDSLNLALALTGIAAFLSGFMVGPATASIQSTVPARMRGIAAAITMFVSALIGQGLGPWAIGYGSDLLSTTLKDQSLATAMSYATIFFVLGGVLYFAGGRHYNRDRVD
jgi:predicted MFS family arabinose efflux permease